jgi:uncharacterized membrane protein (UPF0127 family)
MKTIPKHGLACLPRKLGNRSNYHSWTWIALFPLAFSAGLGIGFHQNAWGELGSLQGNGLASISTPKGSIIFAEIADTPDKRAKGLMHRSSIAPDQGMLFQFPELGSWTFWMKNTKIPLDILWLDKTGTIIHIESDVPICTRTDDHCPRYHSHKKSWQVLELKAGMAEKLELIPGSQLTISVPQNHLPY